MPSSICIHRTRTSPVAPGGPYRAKLMLTLTGSQEINVKMESLHPDLFKEHVTGNKNMLKKRQKRGQKEQISDFIW